MRRADVLAAAGLLLVAIALSAPRLSSPLDLRYDAGVYYVLGTALAEGRGYRLLNEPGDIEAIQYPPLLPALVALHERASGTRDPAVVGRALRCTFTLLLAAEILAAYALARRWLAPGWASAAALLVALHLQLLWLSDLVFADVPFACTATLFLLAAQDRERRWVPGLVGAAAYLLRTAGLALFVAWIAESVLRRRWRETVWRTALAAAPMLVWQSHVAAVHAGRAYREPAYAYQRAAYQYYNVSYGENMSYVDAFAPERGFATPSDLALRVLENARALPLRLGESVSVAVGWLAPLARVGGPGAPVLVVTALGIASAVGVARLAFHGGLLAALYWAGGLVLIVATPFGGQFARYLLPLAPVTAAGLVGLLAGIGGRARPRLVRAVAAAGLAAILAAETRTLTHAFRWFYVPVADGTARVFFYDAAWRSHDAAIAWLGREAPRPAVVAAATPHRIYLATGLRAVLPPFEADVAEAARLLDGVPIDYLVLDELGFADFTRRYAAPVVTAYPERWTLVYGAPDSGSRIYRRAGSPSAP
jgi:hypothetical protein